MPGKSMRRVERRARAFRHGPEILQFVRTPHVRAILIAAAETGTPPVTAISAQLIKLVGAAHARLMPIKQFTGRCVRAVLEEADFELVETGVRLSNDPVFRTASVYKRNTAPEKGDAAKLLVRFIASLTDAEAQQALRLLKKRQ